MSSGTYDTSLLQPTVGLEDDAIGFRRPWNPHSILWVAFFGGLIAAGVLFEMNGRRLGIRRKGGPALLICLGSSLVIYAALVWLFRAGNLPVGEDLRLARNLVRFLHLAVGVGVSATQTRRYQLAVRADVETASLIKPGILAVLAGNAADFAVISVLLLLLKLLGMGAA